MCTAPEKSKYFYHSFGFILTDAEIFAEVDRTEQPITREQQRILDRLIELFTYAKDYYLFAEGIVRQEDGPDLLGDHLNHAGAFEFIWRTFSVQPFGISFAEFCGEAIELLQKFWRGEQLSIDKLRDLRDLLDRLYRHHNAVADRL